MLQMQVCVAYKQLDLITHKSLSRLIKLKWTNFGKYVKSDNGAVV